MDPVGPETMIDIRVPADGARLHHRVVVGRARRDPDAAEARW
jgi:hypothetical protein